MEGTRDYVSITYKELYKDVSPGDTILIDDGLIEMEVKEISGEDIACLVRNGGRLSDQKGVNIPGTELNMEFLSKKDRADLLFGIQEDFDFVAASFTRTAEDIREMRLLLDENGGRDINIIAKIENQQGVDHIDEIIEAADGIMIARGDMGVEIPLERVPVIQQTIIRKVYCAGKQVITATQMLDSMMEHPRPTRAETSDIANAIYQGTSAIMLSGETAAGKYPVRALQTHSGSQRNRIYGPHDLQVPSGLHDRGVLQFPEGMPPAQYVLGNLSPLYQGGIQFGDSVPAGNGGGKTPRARRRWG